MTPKALINRILVTIDKKFQDLVGDIIIDTTIKPGWYATVIGKVKSVPELIDNDPFRKDIVRSVQVGDEIAFSYHVVFDQTYTDNAERVFFEEPLINPFITSWSNRRGERLVALNTQNGRFKMGHYDPEGREVEETEVTMKGKENWLGKFTFNETNDVTYNNLMVIDNVYYWGVDYSQVFAIKRGGEIIMVGGYVMLDPVGSMSIDDTYDTRLILHNAPRKKIEWCGRGRILNIGEPLKGRKRPSCDVGDLVVFDKRYAEQYVLWGKEVVLIKQERIRGRVLEGVPTSA
jgi:co-chaperonin GroES (HSP10)